MQPMEVYQRIFFEGYAKYVKNEAIYQSMLTYLAESASLRSDTYRSPTATKCGHTVCHQRTRYNLANTGPSFGENVFDTGGLAGRSRQARHAASGNAAYSRAVVILHADAAGMVRPFGV